MTFLPFRCLLISLLLVSLPTSRPQLSDSSHKFFCHFLCLPPLPFAFSEEFLLHLVEKYLENSASVDVLPLPSTLHLPSILVPPPFARSPSSAARPSSSAPLQKWMWRCSSEASSTHCGALLRPLPLPLRLCPCGLAFRGYTLRRAWLLGRIPANW